MDYPNNEIKALVEGYNETMKNKNYELGLRQALVGYELSRKQDNHVYTMFFLAELRIAAAQLYDHLSIRKKSQGEQIENKCSFCHKSGKDIRLIFGKDGISICIECAKIAIEGLTDGAK